MSMSVLEARQAAFDPINSHATVTLDLAVATLHGNLGRDHAAYRQLATIKAALQRLQQDVEKD